MTTSLHETEKTSLNNIVSYASLIGAKSNSSSDHTSMRVSSKTWDSSYQNAMSHLSELKKYPQFIKITKRFESVLKSTNISMKSAKRITKDTNPDQRRVHQIIRNLHDGRQNLNSLIDEIDRDSHETQRNFTTRRFEPQKSRTDEEIDEAKQRYEETKEKFKLSIRLLIEHMERMTQVTQKITS
jgi:hypothetical protein